MTAEILKKNSVEANSPASSDGVQDSLPGQHEKRTTNDDDESSTHGWTDPNDPALPYNWPSSRKWTVTLIALLGTLIVPWNGTSITVAAREINRDFSISDDPFPHSYWAVTSWSLGGAVSIIFLLPLLEDFGVRTGHLVSYVVFLLFIIPQALARNFATLVVTRFFSGGCVALIANSCASIIPDLWRDERGRSLPVSIYIFFYIAGSTLGPPLFAGVVQNIGDWRW
jgi:MFS family permease